MKKADQGTTTVIMSRRQKISTDVRTVNEVGKRSKVKNVKRDREPSRGAYHLHGKPGNSGWKMKWYIPFHLKHFRNYRLST